MKTTFKLLLIAVTTILFSCSSNENKHVDIELSKAKSTPNDTIIAKYYDSNFPIALGNYNGISAASDGNIYYVLCCRSIDTAGQMFCYHPKTQKIEHLGDLSEVCGEKGTKAIPQGKCHVDFCEYNGKLYFATHIDHYDNVGGKELLKSAPEGHKPYPGGHILSYDLKTKEFEDIYKAPENEGILTLAMDTTRGRIICTTWPSAITFSYDVPTKEYKYLGRFAEDAEATTNNETYQVINRSITVNPHTGNAYFNNVEGQIFKYSYKENKVDTIIEDNLVKSEFGDFKVNEGRTCGYMWRQSIWSEFDKKIYGYNHTKEVLYNLDPQTNKVEIVGIIASAIRQKTDSMGNGGSLGMAMGLDGHTIYYISHAYPEIDYSKLTKKEKSLISRKGNHLISYDLETNHYADLGLIVFENGIEPRHINSLTIGADGTFYAMCYIEVDGIDNVRSDMISFPNPTLK